MPKGKGALGALDTPERFTGTVRWFSDPKGFGFIAPDDTQAIKKDVFVHFSAITGMNGRKSLQEGDQVEFAVVQGGKGPQAADLIVL